MWQGKTYIGRPHDNVEGKEVKLKGKSSKDVFKVGKGTEQHQARLQDYKSQQQQLKMTKKSYHAVKGATGRGESY